VPGNVRKNKLETSREEDLANIIDPRASHSLISISAGGWRASGRLLIPLCSESDKHSVIGDYDRVTSRGGWGGDTVSSY